MKKKIGNMSDTELHNMAIDLGSHMDKETFLHIVQSFMMQNHLAELNFEMVLPSKIARNPKWQMKYSAKEFVLKEKESAE